MNLLGVDLTRVLLAALVLRILVALARKTRLSIHNRRCAREHGCLPPRQLPTRRIWGMDHWWALIQAAKRREHVQHVANRYKTAHTFTMPMFTSTVVATIEPENIKTILATSFKDFGLGKARQANFGALLGTGIFTVDGHAWEGSRTLLRPQFTRDQVSDLDALEVHVQRLLHLVPDGGVVNLQPLFFRLTLDSATEFLFGESVDSLLESDTSDSSAYSKSEFARSFDRAQDYIAWRGRFQKFFWLFNSKEFRNDCATVHRLADHFVQKALNAEKPATPVHSGKRYFISEQLATRTRDAKVMRDQMLNVLLAGRDTTAGLLGWTFYLLARNPAVYKKLRNEIIQVFGTEDSNKMPTFASLKDVVYLRYVLNEGNAPKNTMNHP